MEFPFPSLLFSTRFGFRFDCFDLIAWRFCPCGDSDFDDFVSSDSAHEFRAPHLSILFYLI